jgi:hypothetical protein
MESEMRAIAGVQQRRENAANGMGWGGGQLQKASRTLDALKEQVLMVAAFWDALSKCNCKPVHQNASPRLKNTSNIHIDTCVL